jgi:predicted nucleotidyltransferase component of viral defense system
MNLCYYTVSDFLLDSLKKLMNNKAFDDFVLVGGTALSLQLGHRISADIDLFTEKSYNSINMERIKNALQYMFEYTEGIESLNNSSIGYSVYIGKNEATCIKLDMYHTENFIAPIIHQDELRLASMIDIAGMKIAAITNRKKRKDFWDIHELLEHYQLLELINWGLLRNPYSLIEKDIIEALEGIDELEDETPVQCLKGKYWEFIQSDIKNAVEQYKKVNTISKG